MRAHDDGRLRRSRKRTDHVRSLRMLHWLLRNMIGAAGLVKQNTNRIVTLGLTFRGQAKALFNDRPFQVMDTDGRAPQDRSREKKARCRARARQLRAPMLSVRPASGLTTVPPQTPTPEFMRALRRLNNTAYTMRSLTACLPGRRKEAGSSFEICNLTELGSTRPLRSR